MSKFHITPTLCLYNAIQFPNYNAVPSAPESAGLSLYHDNGASKIGGALYISVRSENAINGGSSFEYRPMLNKITGGSGILVTPNGDDPGHLTISLDGGGGGSSDSSVIFKHIECTEVNSSGCCYAQINGITDSGFVYRAYRIPTGTSKQENINVNCYPYSLTVGATTTIYLAIDFDSSVTFNNLKSGAKDSKVHVEILKGSAAMGEPITPETNPGTQPGGDTPVNPTN